MSHRTSTKLALYFISVIQELQKDPPHVEALHRFLSSQRPSPRRTLAVTLLANICSYPSLRKTLFWKMYIIVLHIQLQPRKTASFGHEEQRLKIQ